VVCPCNEPWSSEHDPNEPLVALATRRRPTPILVVDREYRIIAQSLGLDIAALAPYVRRLVERHVQERSASRMTVEVLDTTTALRVVDLTGPENSYFAITFERTEQLFISKSTARDHAKNILRKMGTSRRTKLFAKVIKYEDRPTLDS
jgi:hypothetical protein